MEDPRQNHERPDPRPHRRRFQHPSDDRPEEIGAQGFRAETSGRETSDEYDGRECRGQTQNECRGERPRPKRIEHENASRQEIRH